ncbi:FGGY family carbohydrate kinase [Glycomyces dulcitolivorans]|uniref:FGGY family carbohydrate kinase n=1 Tax=Glycomyces dulcitolivorans TaxID=2200759 RepID=UPI000DD49C5A|nr:FGGY family carbohydrate kinase [Glycomyces dulcitolivorans]
MTAISIDAGTTAIKAVAHAGDGTELAVARRSVAVERPRPGWAEQDMADVWRATAEAVRDVAAALPEPPQRIALTAQGDGCWLVDAQGEPTGPAVLWSDGRAADIVDRWRDEGRLAEAFRANGSLTFPGLPNAVLAWLDAHDPDRLDRSHAALTCGGWVFHNLTGLFAADESDASAPFLDPATRDYSPRLVELFGLSRAARLLPQVLGDGRRAAALRPEAAAALGLPAGLPVVMAPYDVASTAIGAGAATAGTGCAILGTTLCTEIVRAGTDTSGEPAGLTVALDSAGQWLRVYPTLAGTEVIDWATAMLGLDSPEALGDLAAQAPPGAGGLVFLPYLSPAGERAPFLDTAARGTFWGLTLEHGREHLARAVFEGLTLTIKDCLAASGADVGELRVCGGGASSDFWCRMIADATGVPVARTADTEIGAKGAFLSGLVATGDEPDLATAAAKYVRTGDRFEPEGPEPYSRLYGEFLDLREIARAGWRRQRG